MTDTAPRVTFLMATHEIGPHFDAALASCLNQTFESFEVVLVANGLTDLQYETLLVRCGAMPRVRVFRTSIRRLTFSLNLGLHEARGDLVARMDSDDLCYPSRLASQVRFMDEHPEVTLCGTDCDLIDGSGTVVGEWRYPTGHEEIASTLRRSNPFCHPAVMFRREALLQLGGYCGQFAEDYFTWVLLAEQPDTRFAGIREKLIAYRADHVGHRRRLTWRKAKAMTAAAQLQMFGVTHRIGWLAGALYNLAKTFARH